MISGSGATEKKPTLWYGWVILGVVFLIMSAMVSARNSLGFFFKTISGEFGWNRAQTAGAFSIGMLVQALCSPLFGSLGERWSLRWMMAAGVFFGGAALLIGSSIGGLWQFYLMYALLNVGFSASTFVPQVQILSNWFVRKRGLAMGIANSGQGFAAVLNLTIPFLIAAIGWRSSYLVLAGFIMICVFPTAAVLLRDDPRRRATVADAPFLSAVERSDAHAKETASPVGRNAVPAVASFWPRVFSLRFLLVALIFSAVAFSLTGTTVHIVPHATDQGFTPEQSAFIFLLWGICAISGNLISGISDSLGRVWTFCVGTALGLCACALLALFAGGMSPVWFYGGAALSGLSLGLMRPTASAFLADHFAGPGFGKLNGTAVTIFALSGALGSYAMGYLFDISGSYRSAFTVIAVLSLAGAGSAVALGRMDRPAQTRNSP
ncbi:MAG: MFS transporter [Thermodesulfobacteriota bacterium]